MNFPGPPPAHSLRVVAGAMAAALLATGCLSTHTGPAAADPPAYENLLLVLADFRQFSDTDLYRFEPPRDVSNQNVFRATLVRLNGFERDYPEAARDYADIVEFTRAEALARLGDFSASRDAFRSLAQRVESPLGEPAATRAKVFGRVADVLERPVRTGGLADYLEGLEFMQRDLESLAESLEKPVDRAMARREAERIEGERALALFRNRYVMEDGAARGLDLSRQMTERHAESRLRAAHHLRLGEFYRELARDLLALTPPSRIGFDEERFFTLTAAAREQFLTVSLADGFPQKPEGEALLRAVEALEARVRQALQ